MADRQFHLHPITLLVLAVVVGVGLNFVIWRVIYGQSPAAGRFYHSEMGCLSKRLEKEKFDSLPARHDRSAFRDWLMNDLCALSALLRGRPSAETGTDSNQDPGELPQASPFLQQKQRNVN